MRGMSGLLGLVLIGCGGPPVSDIRQAPPNPTATGSGTGTGTGGTTPTGTTTTDTTPPTLTIDGVPVPPDLSVGTLAQIATDLDAVLATAAANHGVYVIDLENGQVIYGSNEDVPLKPASNTKIFTTAVAMDLLGPDHRFETTAWAPAQPDGNGAVTDLDIVVHHDFTWSNFFYADEFFAADRLADQLYEAGLRQVSGTLTIHGEVVVDGYQFAYYDPDLHRDDAIDVMVSALELAGISVDGGLAATYGFSPGGVLLASRLSPPLSTSAHPLNVYSHNEFADVLARHNGHELWGASTYGDGEAALLDWYDGLGLDSSPLNFEDGSGLSHSNRVTARSVVELQQAMYELPAGQAWMETFSIGGVIGTLGGRMGGADTSGRFFGKSGTLNGVIATSGTLFNRHDGHRYAISVLMNETQQDNSTTRAIQDDVVAVMGADLRGGGARPTAPVLQTAVGVGAGQVELDWEPSANADGYTVWITTDGVWRRTEARYTTDTQVSLVTLDPDRTYAFRVTADGPGGISDPSDTYSVSASAQPASVLVVDGNDRYASQFENPLGTGHRFASITAEALGGRSHDTVANEAVVDGLVSLDDYDAVVWVLGEESTTDLTFDADERAAVDAYLAGGGNLLVSGAEIGWDLDYLGDIDMLGFYTTSLHASYVDDDAGTFSAVPTYGGLFDGVGELGFLTPATLEVNFPDVISPVGGATSELVYVGGIGGTAAISYAGSYRVVHLGFPFEAIDNGPQREAVMAAILGFFGV